MAIFQHKSVNLTIFYALCVKILLVICAVCWKFYAVFKILRNRWLHRLWQISCLPTRHWFYPIFQEFCHCRLGQVLPSSCMSHIPKHCGYPLSIYIENISIGYNPTLSDLIICLKILSKEKSERTPGGRAPSVLWVCGGGGGLRCLMPIYLKYLSDRLLSSIALMF